MKIIIATIKSWNIERAREMQRRLKEAHEVRIFTGKDELTYDNVCDFNPDYIFLIGLTIFRRKLQISGSAWYFI